MIPPQDLIKIEGELTQKLNIHVESEIKNNISRGHNNASDIGFECDTYQALCRLKGELKPRPTVGLKKIFRVGIEWERPNIRWLQDAELQVRETSDKRFEWKEYNIVGYMEADIVIPQISTRMKLPLEHKTVSPNGFREIKKCKALGLPLTQAKQPWVKKYPGQLMTYELFKGVDLGVWFFFEKTSGDFLWWLATLDYDYAESLIKRADRCNENVAKGYLPPTIQKELCNKCDFAHTYCFPDCDYGPGFVFLSHEEAEKRLKRREVLKESHAEYQLLDKSLKDHFRGQSVIIGDFKIETTSHGNGSKVSIEKL